MRIKLILILSVIVFSQMSCGIYSFSGSSIPEDVKTFSVDFFQNKAAIVAPVLSQTLTEKLKSKFISETNLSIQENEGDFHFSGEIVKYTVNPVSAQNSDNANLNRLTIAISAKLVCEKHPELSFEVPFENYQDFDAATNFSTIESQLIDEISDMLIQQVFNKAAINW